MADFGPKSKAEQEHEVAFGVIEVFERPAPPDDMPDAEAEVWRSTLAALRPDWIGPEALPLLANFCEHQVLKRFFKARLDAANETMLATGAFLDKPLVQTIEKYRRMHEAESQMVHRLARSLRLTPQSTRTKDQGKGGFAAAVGDKPIWEDC